MQVDQIRQRIRTAREEKGMSREEIAARLGMDTRNYMRIESGEKKSLDIALLAEISKELDVDLASMLFPDGLYFAPIQNDSPGNVTGVINDNIVINQPAPEEYRTIIDEQRKIIEDQRAIIDSLKASSRKA